MTDIVERLRRRVFRGPTMEVSHTKTVEWEAADEIERLREALREAIDEVEAWASYASPAMQEKHDLEGVLTKLRSALGEDK